VVKKEEYKVEVVEGKKKGRISKMKKPGVVVIKETEENIEFAKLAKEDS
jgi:hypothetical protein